MSKIQGVPDRKYEAGGSQTIDADIYLYGKE